MQIDLKAANAELVSKQMENIFGFGKEELIKVLSYTGMILCVVLIAGHFEAHYYMCIQKASTFLIYLVVDVYIDAFSCSFLIKYTF